MWERERWRKVKDMESEKNGVKVRERGRKERQGKKRRKKKKEEEEKIGWA